MSPRPFAQRLIFTSSGFQASFSLVGLVDRALASASLPSCCDTPPWSKGRRHRAAFSRRQSRREVPRAMHGRKLPALVGGSPRCRRGL